MPPTRVAFLGFVDRASVAPDGHPVLQATHLLGLKQHIASFILPVPLSGRNLVLAVFNAGDVPAFKLEFRTPSGRVDATVSLTTFTSDAAVAQDAVPGEVPVARDTASRTEPEWGLVPPKEQPRGAPIVSFHVGGDSWTVMVLQLPDQILHEATWYSVEATIDDVCTPIGRFLVALQEAPPLSPDRIAAIRTVRGALQAASFDFHCKLCGEGLRFVVALDRPGDLKGHLWYQDVGDRFECRCGRLAFDASHIRKHAHGHLGQLVARTGTINFATLYEKATIDAIVHRMWLLLETTPLEEAIQQYIEQYPAVLAPLRPQRIFFKAPVLTKFKTDIVVLDAVGTLWVVELEAPERRILKQDGGLAAEAQHAIDQIRSWMAEFVEHRAAVLACIGLDPSEVTEVRGLAVVGRRSTTDAEQLRKFRLGGGTGSIELRTYDELLDWISDLSRTLFGR